MANDLQDTIRELLNRAAQEGSKAVPDDASSALSGWRGIAAGAGAAALAPLAAKGIGTAVKNVGAEGLEDLVGGLSDKLGDGLGDMLPGGLGDLLGGGVGPGGGALGALKNALPGVGGGGSQSGKSGGGGSSGTVPGVGKGRRMPVQQSVDIGVPIETVYNQFTQFELWPNFMHRVTTVSQKDDCTVNFTTKIWGKKKEFVAKIETQRPDERIKWKVEQGISHTGVVTFHELGPRLTRVLVGLDLDPGGMLEKAARGMRHVKRAVRADLHRFKAFIEMQEVETGAWRGVIEHGKVTEKHDSSYDKSREYSSFQDVFKGPRAKKPTPSETGSRSSSRSSSSRSSSSRSGSGSSRSGSSRSGSPRSGSSRSSSSRSGSSRASSSGSGSSSRSRGSSNGGSPSSRGRSSGGRSSGGRSSGGRSSGGANHSEGRTRTRRRS